MSQFPEGDPILRMPECDKVVLQAWMDCGIAHYTDSGGSLPLPWTEIRAYSNGNLTEWECKQVRMMSETYCSQKAWAEKHRYGNPPYQPELTDEEMAARAELSMKQLDAAFNV